MVTRLFITTSSFLKINFINVPSHLFCVEIMHHMTQKTAVAIWQISLPGLGEDFFCESNYVPVLAVTVYRLQFMSFT